MRALAAAALLGTLLGCSGTIHYWREKHPRFGTANPELMNLPFWERMIKTGQSAYAAQKEYGDTRSHDGPVWTFDRVGMTKTKLADGTTLCIGGEHEDYYDPNFNIYNDVIALKPDGSADIYGYPQKDFPPTDFHTATLVDGDIYIIGALGYVDRRAPGRTPVYRLNAASKRMEPFATSGAPPGWIFGHKAVYDAKRRAITITGGQVQATPDASLVRDNFDEYRLRLKDGVWEKLTDRHWPQFRVGLAGKHWINDGQRSVKIDDLLPSIPHALVTPKPPAKRDDDAPLVGWTVRDIVVRGVTVHYALGLQAVKLTVEGPLPASVMAALTDDLSVKLRRVVGAECRVDRL